jgi:hypothetical protein
LKPRLTRSREAREGRSKPTSRDAATPQRKKPEKKVFALDFLRALASSRETPGMFLIFVASSRRRVRRF